ncbi:MAG: sugar phosphate isomerase/epimerase [Acidobacteriaceae bacterium]|nr:sugar phosphate isomerase/epimerase [Acidobacteriaceae bacterium]
MSLGIDIFSRRTFLERSGAALAVSKFALSAPVPLRIGVTDWNLKQGANPDAVPLAAKLGFSGVQVSFGRELRDGKMPADNPEIIAQYLSLSKQYKLPIDGTCVDRLHDNGLKSDKEAPKWVLDSIRLTKDLGTKVLLVPFFGRWAIQNQSEMDYVGDALRDLGPEAEKAGVILGIEDTISAKDNVRIMDRSRSHNVKVYYDVGNSTIAGFDILKEIRWLGKDRICQFHLKDNPHYLGQGKIRFGPVIRTIKDIGYTGWANLETDAHPQSLEADMRRNLLYIQRLIRDRY